MRRVLFVLFAITAIAISAWFLTSGGPRVVRPDLEQDQTAAAMATDSFEIGSLGWNRFRGPNGSGISADSEIPLEWSPSKNVRWKTELPGMGSSSPVLSKDSVFLTACEFERQNNGELASLKRFVLCYDRNTGDEKWRKEIDGRLPEDPFIGNGLPEHGYATNTPVVDDEHVYVFLGKSGVYCFDFEGNQIWKRDVGRGSNPKGWGSCSSLITYNDLVIVNAAEESNAIIALEKSTGEERWKTESPSLNFAFSTPALVEVGDSIELVFVLVGEIWGINPESGKLLWYTETPIAGNVSPCVTVAGDLVYCFGGYRSVGSICVQAGGRGDVSKSHVQWTSKLTSYISTPILLNERIFWIDSRSRYFCQDAKTGETISKGRGPSMSAGQPIYASAIAINEKIYLQTRNDGLLVIEPDESMTVLHQNTLDDNSTANATPAVGEGQLFLRSDNYLACIQQDLN